MRIIQTGIRVTAPVVGRITLEDSNGIPVFTVLYQISPNRRERELFCEDGVYVQQRQDENGAHIYRWNRVRGAAQPVTEHLSDYQPIELSDAR